MSEENILHHCPSEKVTGDPVQFVNGKEWSLWVYYDDGCWVPIDYCPYCGLKLAGTEK